MNTRRGSFLLLCIAMMALLILIGFELLRTVQLQTDASTNNQRVLLAQSAAEAGLEHATEQILADYNAPSSQVLSDASSQFTMASVRPVTFLDGPYRANFQALNYPDRPDIDQNPPDADKDARLEHPVLRPYTLQNGYDGRWSWDGMSEMVGRARYYEPNYYNMQVAPLSLPQYPSYYPCYAPPVIVGQPAPVSFVDMNAAQPSRSNAIFYDEQFRKIVIGNGIASATAARQAARYRLRYAVNDDDLSGNILLNPQSDPNLPQDYRTPPRWIAESADALTSMLSAQCGSDSPDYSWDAAKVAHVFLGRGYSGNVDLDAKGFPCTFPLMYRNGNGGDPNCHYQVFQWWPGANQLTQTLYQNQVVHGDMNGGEQLYVNNNDGSDPYVHALMGPTMSWWNAFYAASGNNQDPWRWINPSQLFFSTTPFGHALVQPPGYPNTYSPTARKWYQGRVNTPFYVNLLTAPPWVINSMLFAYLPPKFKTFTLSTAIFYKWTGVDKDGNNQYDQNNPVYEPLNPTDPAYFSNLYGRDLLVDTTSPAFAEFQAPQREGASCIYNGQVIKPDYYINDPRLASPCPYPNEYPGQRVYPGLAWNGNPTIAGQGSDDAGKFIQTNNLGYGADVYIWQPFFRMDPPTTWETYGNLWKPVDLLPPATPPSWFSDNNNNEVILAPAGDPQLYSYSYWWDIYSAMSMAITVMRAQWQNVQGGYPFIPSKMFPPGFKNPANFQTIRDLDRLFLAYLGENLDQPGSPPTWNNTYYWHYHNDNNSNNYQLDPMPAPGWPLAQSIRSLLNNQSGSTDTSNQQSITYPPDPLAAVDPTGGGGGMTGKARAAVMERVLNDFRMAFFGSSPEYSDYVDPITGVRDPSKDFRPLDFDGDGVVHCSCYQDPTAQFFDPNAAVHPGTVPIVNPSGPADALGRGPAIDPSMYFSPSGCFFIGKSHYFRVLSRGELWDNQLNEIVNEATLETVLAVDPEGNNPVDTQTLFQRWHFDRYQGLMPHVKY